MQEHVRIPALPANLSRFVMPLSEGNATKSIDGDGLCRRKKDEAHGWNAMILFVRGHEVKEPNVAIVEL